MSSQRPPSSLRHFLRDDDLSPLEQHEVLELALRLKADPFATPSLAGPRTVATIYDKPTLRTQVSFAAGIAELGGHPMLIEGSLAGIGVRESVADVARILGRQAALIVWRTYQQAWIAEMAQYAGVPVINALTDDFHPCQLMADLLTIREHRGPLAGLTVTFVGDGACNVPVSWVWAASKLGFELRIAAPKAYQPSSDLLARAGGNIVCTENVNAAASGADLLYTDVFVSMGKEAESADRLKDLAPYPVNADLVKRAKPDALVMHCLPAYRGKEISEETLEAHADTIFTEAENRLHTQKAILAWLVG